ncbi:MAG TPA: hypothetical protein VMT60_04440, partial [Candidatus Bathyarchaeia archaeon]|nr:hypothetical protein [Candidatus Bathyarchaeia archaeon]
MARNRAHPRTTLITLGVIVGVFIVAVVALRLFLTKEKLLAIVVPRVEKAVDAKVSITDIGISFPLGLGVDIDGLSFEKTLPDTSALTFTSKKVTVRSSLISLIKRRPEIKAADVRGGVVIVKNPNKLREIKLLGVGAHVTMKPAGERFAVGARVLVDSVLVSVLGRPPAVSLEKVGFDGALETDRDFTTVAVKDANVSWANLFSAKVGGEVVNAKTAPRVKITVQSAEAPLAPLIERVTAFRLDELAPTGKRPARPQSPGAPVSVSAGTFGFSAQVEGLVKDPASMNLSFECSVKNVAVRAVELASIPKLSASLKGQGVALAWQNLFPGPAKPETPAQIGVAWQAVKLEGTIELEGGDLLLQSAPPPGGSAAVAAGSIDGAPRPAGAAPPIHVSSLKARAEISGPDVKKVSGAFNIGGSPYSFEGSMINVGPAAAELSLDAQRLQASGQKTLPDLGSLLDRMANAPVVKFDVSGRSFDARPYEKPLPGVSGDGKKAAAAGKTAAPGEKESPAGETAPSAIAPGAILILKNTTFTAKIDSIVAREAVLTRFQATGTIRDGRVKVDPVTFAYAGGTGTTAVNADLRKIERIETKADLSVKDVEAGQALQSLGAAAGLVEGKFSCTSNASFSSGSGVDPLAALSATGLALSSKGSVSFERFLQPLANIKGFDVTAFNKFDFKDWRGSFV